MAWGWRRWIAALLLAGAAGCSRPVVRTVVVAGDVPWTDTGIDLVLGRQVHIQATGEVFANQTLSAGPDGIAGRPDLARYNVVEDAQHVALIGKIGEDGTPFLVGAEDTFVVRVDGRLYLGPNDRGTNNNRGEFLATVTVR